MSLSICLSRFVSLFLAFINCLAMAMDMLRLTVCWNQMDGGVVWWVSPYVSVDISHQMALTPCRRRCAGDVVAKVKAL